MLKAQLDPRVDAVYKVLRGRINWDNLVPACVEAMFEIQQFTQLRGPQKLELLQAVMKQALRDSDKSLTEKEQILHSIDTIIPLVAQGVKLATKLKIQPTCWKKCMF